MNFIDEFCIPNRVGLDYREKFELECILEMMNGVYIFFQRMESLAKVFQEYLRSVANVIILVGNKFSGIKVLVEDDLVQGGSIFCPQIRAYP